MNLQCIEVIVEKESSIFPIFLSMIGQVRLYRIVLATMFNSHVVPFCPWITWLKVRLHLWWTTLDRRGKTLLAESLSMPLLSLSLLSQDKISICPRGSGRSVFHPETNSDMLATPGRAWLPSEIRLRAWMLHLLVVILVASFSQIKKTKVINYASAARWDHSPFRAAGTPTVKAVTLKIALTKLSF